MPTAVTLPTFKAIRDVIVDVEAKTIAIIFESDTHEQFQVVFSAEVVAPLIPTLLEKTPPSPNLETSESFVAPVMKFRSGVLEGGRPTLGLFFPSGIPVSVLLDDKSISSMIFALKELQSIVSSKGHEKQKH